MGSNHSAAQVLQSFAFFCFELHCHCNISLNLSVVRVLICISWDKRCYIFFGKHQMGWIIKTKEWSWTSGTFVQLFLKRKRHDKERWKLSKNVQLKWSWTFAVSFFYTDIRSSLFYSSNLVWAQVAWFSVGNNWVCVVFCNCVSKNKKQLPTRKISKHVPNLNWALLLLSVLVTSFFRLI